MAGYWPSSFFCVFMDQDGVKVSKLTEKERGQLHVFSYIKLTATQMKFESNFICIVFQT